MRCKRHSTACRRHSTVTAVTGTSQRVTIHRRDSDQQTVLHPRSAIAARQWQVLREVQATRLLYWCLAHHSSRLSMVCGCFHPLMRCGRTGRSLLKNRLRTSSVMLFLCCRSRRRPSSTLVLRHVTHPLRLLHGHRIIAGMTGGHSPRSSVVVWSGGCRTVPRAPPLPSTWARRCVRRIRSPLKSLTSSISPRRHKQLTVAAR
jgi:hypothetical protein